MPIGKFEGVEEALTRIAGLTYIMDAARIMTAGALDQGEKPSVISAIIKYHTTEMMRTLINDAMDIQGGSGICLGNQNLIGRIYQSLPIAITVEGANILTRSMIIYGQGAIRCHPFVFEEMLAVAEKDQQRAVQLFDRAIFGHIGFTLSNLLRSLILMLCDAWIVRSPAKSESHRYIQHLTRMSSAFAFCSDIAMFGLGGKLKFKEKLSARLGDALSYLYLASAVIKRYNDMGQPEDDRRLLRWACDECLYKIESSLLMLAKNYPVRPLGWLMRIVVAPFFTRYRPPTDELGHAVTAVLLTPSMARERLTKGIYIPTSQNDALANIEDALYKIIMAEPIEKKIRYAVKRGKLPSVADDILMPMAVNLGIIDEHEMTIYRNAVEARQKVIQVNAFSSDFSSTSESHDPEKDIQKAGLSG
jgi:acyl-CoA dehydrogenase